MRVVYLDVLFAVNVCTALLQLAATALLCRRRLSALRSVLSCGLVAALSCGVFFAPESVWLSAAARLLLPAAAVAVGFRRPGRRVFFKCWLTYCGVGVILAGLVLAVSLWLLPGAVSYGNTALYVEVSPLLLIGCCGGSYLLLALFSRLTARQPAAWHCRVTVTFAGRSVTVRALADSGNALRDGLTDAPVIVMGLQELSPLLPEGGQAFFLNGGTGGCADPAFCRRVRLLPCRTVAGKSLLPAFRPDRVQTDFSRRDGGWEEIPRALVAVSRERLSEDYGALLNAEIFK